MLSGPATLSSCWEPGPAQHGCGDVVGAEQVPGPAGSWDGAEPGEGLPHSPWNVGVWNLATVNSPWNVWDLDSAADNSSWALGFGPCKGQWHFDIVLLTLQRPTTLGHWGLEAAKASGL